MSPCSPSAAAAAAAPAAAKGESLGKVDVLHLRVRHHAGNPGGRRRHQLRRRDQQADLVRRLLFLLFLLRPCRRVGGRGGH